MVVEHRSKFVNPAILSQLNSPEKGKRKVKKVRVRDPEWLKISSKEDMAQRRSDEDIVEESCAKTEASIEDERKLRRIARFKQRRNQAIN